MNFVEVKIVAEGDPRLYLHYVVPVVLTHVF